MPGVETNACWLVGCLEVCLRSELEDTRIGNGVDSATSVVICVRAGTEVTIKNAGINSGELRVVPGVETLRLELYAGAFGEVKVLEQRNVPSVASGALH